MTGFALRPATADDAASVAQIWREGWSDGHRGHVPDALVAVRTPESFDSDTAVAVVDGEVAGFTMVVGDELEQLYVSRSHRGRIAEAPARRRNGRGRPSQGLVGGGHR